YALARSQVGGGDERPRERCTDRRNEEALVVLRRVSAIDSIRAPVSRKPIACRDVVAADADALLVHRASSVRVGNAPTLRTKQRGAHRSNPPCRAVRAMVEIDHGAAQASPCL